MMRHHHQIYKRLLPIFLAGVATLWTGCSKQAFNVVSSVQTQESPGTFAIPAKADILLAVDDTGSIAESFSVIKQEIPKFLEGLESNGWDYHFATTPLATVRSIDEIIASKHDANWAEAGRSQWTPPFPGATVDFPGLMIPSEFFTEPSQYTEFIDFDDINYSLNGLEPGFDVIRNALVNELPGTGFLRDDAMLIVLVIGNGNDTSGVTSCVRPDGWVGPCEQIGRPGTAQISFDYYQEEFGNIKANEEMFSMFTATAFRRKSNCRGSHSLVGTRYQKMAKAFGGRNYDICNQEIDEVLSGIGEALTQQRFELMTRFLVMEQEPDVNSIVVTRFPGGEVIPQDPVNGWTYEGFQTVFTLEGIDSPIQINQRTGYVVQLHGSAILTGTQRATIESRPAGSQPTLED